MDKYALFASALFISGCGFYLFKSNNQTSSTRSPTSMRKISKKREFNDEMEGFVQNRVPSMNNQNSFNLRDPAFKEDFFKKE